MTLEHVVVESPIGPVHLVSDGRALCALELGDTPLLRPALARRFGPDLALRAGRDPLGLASRARAWFAGDLGALDGLPLDPGGTPFQRQVWDELRRIPAGETRSYGALAAALGRPGAARAVGLANGRNPIAIAIPCHRVIGADGSLTGYAGGLDRKRWLLAHERAALDGAVPRAPAGVAHEPGAVGGENRAAMARATVRQSARTT
ncbi:methylated-DNA/protein-cysteine methyltransferase [Anaeromyxobacter sp. K]|uniref:methylated-DNA--[protein]-cysteine S-methyltransferase n=1 Tax=Anaeromyxobacter sp. (strain K) TaxID=447217 RepID=UPI00015F9D06|nr:methylated-DNA--[protein]-cysteine S-methyltransferase [Anaeromyxobacter sp. K]ACG72266.1 methylated-DNA/protein-cysteine methyltransferase [Anaeromyxobacter sp. K]